MERDFQITAAQAEALLLDGATTVHNFKPMAVAMLGTDYTRQDAIEAFRKAYAIGLGGDSCRALKHPIAVWHAEDDVSFFEADMAKVEAFEVANPPPVRSN